MSDDGGVKGGEVVACNREVHLPLTPSAADATFSGDVGLNLVKLYKCEICEGCPHKSECCHGNGDRTVWMNSELTTIHQEVLVDLQSELGIRLRTNRSIQAEGTFGSIKWNRSYKRAQRRGHRIHHSEVYPDCRRFNLYKHHNKKQRVSMGGINRTFGSLKQQPAFSKEATGFIGVLQIHTICQIIVIIHQ